MQRRSSEPLVKQPCPELVSITLSTMPIQSITTLLGGCELPALKQADICLPAISDSGARPYELDFLDVLPNTLAELKLTEDGRCYDASSIDWHKVAEAFPQLKQLRSNLSTTVFCGPKAPFAELVNLTLVYPRPSPLSFLRCLKDEACELLCNNNSSAIEVANQLTFFALPCRQGCPTSLASTWNAGADHPPQNTSTWTASTTLKKRAKCLVCFTCTRLICWTSR